MAITSKQFTINWRDIARGVILAGIAAALDAIFEALVKPGHVIDWNNVGTTTVIAIIAYLKLNFFSKSKKFTKAE